MTADKRAEILTKAKPILFNTEMVRAILDGRKTQTRRVIKPQSEGAHNIIDYDDDSHTVDFLCGNCGAGGAFVDWAETVKAPYWYGDILYVRETFCQPAEHIYWYKADSKVQNVLWKPSIHMPKEAARIFLRVTNVRVERLQEIAHSGIEKEGVVTIGTPGSPERVNPFFAFKSLWNSTIKKSDLDRYVWEANPWVWVIEFERLEIKQNSLC